MEHNVEHIRREAFKEGKHEKAGDVREKVKEAKRKERAKTLKQVEMMLGAVSDLSRARQMIRAWLKEPYNPRA